MWNSRVWDVYCTLRRVTVDLIDCKRNPTATTKNKKKINYELYMACESSDKIRVTPVDCRSPSIQRLTIKFWMAKKCGVSASYPNSLPHIKSRNSDIHLSYHSATRMKKTTIVARTSVPSLGQFWGFEGMCLKIDTVVFGNLDLAVESASGSLLSACTSDSSMRRRPCSRVEEEQWTTKCRVF